MDRAFYVAEQQLRMQRPSERAVLHGVREIPDWYAISEQRRMERLDREANWAPFPPRARDLPGYDGRSPITALELCVSRSSLRAQAYADCGQEIKRLQAMDDAEHYAAMINALNEHQEHHDDFKP
jgi:hypothetical protein